MAGRVTAQQLISAPPALVQATDDDLATYLAGLNPPDFLTAADPKALWAVVAANAGNDDETGGTAFVISAEAYKQAVKGRRFSQ